MRRLRSDRLRAFVMQAGPGGPVVLSGSLAAGALGLRVYRLPRVGRVGGARCLLWGCGPGSDLAASAAGRFAWLGGAGVPCQAVDRQAGIGPSAGTRKAHARDTLDQVIPILEAPLCPDGDETSGHCGPDARHVGQAQRVGVVGVGMDSWLCSGT